MRALKLFLFLFLLSFTVWAQTGIFPLATASGTDTYTATVTPAFSTYLTGHRFNIKFTNANTGAATLNINSKGAIALKKSGTVALAANDISAGQVFIVQYDGTNMQLIGGAEGWKTSGTTTLTDATTIQKNSLTGAFTIRNGTVGSTKVGELNFPTAGGVELLGKLAGGGIVGIIHASDIEAIFGSYEGIYLYVNTGSPGMFMYDNTNETGMGYASDYSVNGVANHGNRWIPDVGHINTLLYPTASTGADVAFDIPRTYGYSADITGNITFTTTGLKEGVTQLMIHNDSVEPTFEAGMVVVSGSYVTGVDNYIMFHAVKSTLILVAINQEL